MRVTTSVGKTSYNISQCHRNSIKLQRRYLYDRSTSTNEIFKQVFSFPDVRIHHYGTRPSGGAVSLVEAPFSLLQKVFVEIIFFKFKKKKMTRCCFKAAFIDSFTCSLLISSDRQPGLRSFRWSCALYRFSVIFPWSMASSKSMSWPLSEVQTISVRSKFSCFSHNNYTGKICSFMCCIFKIKSRLNDWSGNELELRRVDRIYIVFGHPAPWSGKAFTIDW